VSDPAASSPGGPPVPGPASPADLFQEGLEHRPPHAEGGKHGAHPTEAQYVRVAVVLAVLTAIEVSLYYLKAQRTITNGALLVLAGAKFCLVALYFMHLRFDNRILRRFFVGGFALAVFVYVAYLVTLGVFVR
jgi:cytochrome c oxidase subunit 4